MMVILQRNRDSTVWIETELDVAYIDLDAFYINAKIAVYDILCGDVVCTDIADYKRLPEAA